MIFSKTILEWLLSKIVFLKNYLRMYFLKKKLKIENSKTIFQRTILEFFFKKKLKIENSKTIFPKIIL